MNPASGERHTRAKNYFWPSTSIYARRGLLGCLFSFEHLEVENLTADFVISLILRVDLQARFFGLTQFVRGWFMCRHTLQ
jgi:hypothetical protein